jgi:hypothetical protein
MQDRQGQGKETVVEMRAVDEAKTRKPWEKAGGGGRLAAENTDEQRDGDDSATRRDESNDLSCVVFVLRQNGKPFLHMFYNFYEIFP